MQPTGVGNTRILIDYAQKSPWTLGYSQHYQGGEQIGEGKGETVYY